MLGIGWFLVQCRLSLGNVAATNQPIAGPRHDCIQLVQQAPGLPVPRGAASLLVQLAFYCW